MKKSSVEQLLKMIEKQYDSFNRRLNLFGRDDELTLATFHELLGLEEAFKIVTGKTVVEYVLSSDFNREV